MLGPIAAARPRVPIARTPVATMPGEEPAPARVEDARRRALARRARAIAIGMQSAVSSSIARPGSSLHSPSQWSYTVPGVTMPRGCARVTVAPCRCQAIVAPSGIGADRVAEPDPVLDDARRIVLGEDAEVERFERRPRSRRRRASRTRRGTARARASRRLRRRSSTRAFQNCVRALEQRVSRVERRLVDDVVQEIVAAHARARARG